VQVPPAASVLPAQLSLMMFMSPVNAPVVSGKTLEAESFLSVSVTL
jgi:hypothetical protein